MNDSVIGTVTIRFLILVLRCKIFLFKVIKIKKKSSFQAFFIFMFRRSFNPGLSQSRPNYFISILGVPFPPSNKLTTAEVFDSRTNKPKPEVQTHFSAIRIYIFFLG